MTGWIMLGNEIALKACTDYAHYLNELQALRGKKEKWNQDKALWLMGQIEQCEGFFRSRYGAVICPDCDLEKMMGIARVHRRKVNRKWRMLRETKYREGQ